MSHPIVGEDSHALEAGRRTDVSRLFGVGPRNAVVPSWLQQGSRALAEEVHAALDRIGSPQRRWTT